MKRNNIEETLHRAVWQYLRYACPDVLCWHTPSGGYRDVIEAAKFKALGVIPGVPDLILFWQGGLGAIELKAGKNKLTDSQLSFRDAWVERGGKFSLCYSLEEVENTVKEWGLAPKFKPPLSLERSERQMQYQAIIDAMKP